MTKPMRILLVDDHALFRKGVASLLTPLDDMEVVGEAGDGAEAIEKALELKPDLILMDIQMPGKDGLETTRLIKEDLPTVKIVMLAIPDKDDDLLQAIKNGAQGYLMKGIEPEELIRLLRGVHRGEAPFSSLSAAKIPEEFSRIVGLVNSEQNPKQVLTSQRKEALQHVADGATYREIATKLFISENTVKIHLSNILTKLHMHMRSRAQAVTYAVRETLIDDPRLGN